MKHLESPEWLRAKFLRFGVSGLIATLTYFILALLLERLFPGRELSVSFLAYCCCITVSYYLQRKFTFKSRDRMRLELPRFLIASLFGLLLSTLIVHVVTHWLGWPALVAFSSVVATIPLLSFLLFNQFVFRPSQRH